MRLEAAFLLLCSFGMMADGVRAEDEGIAAGGKRSCVPNADRTGWECAEATSNPASAEAAEPAAPVTPEAPPPAMLAAPEDDVAPLSDFYRVVPDTEPQADPLPETVLAEPQAMAQEESIAEPTSEPAVAATPEPMPEPVPEVVAVPEPEPAPVPEPEPLPEPVVAAKPVPEPVVAPEPLAEPEPLEPEPLEPEPLPEPVVAAPEPAPPAPALVPEPAPAPVVMAPSPPAAGVTPALADIAGARDFARLQANAYTLQLSDGASPNGFPALIQALGLSPDQCYLLRIKRDGQSWWLLAYGQYADANRAKAELARLPNVPGLTRTWPRKIQYLQREFDPIGP